MAIVSTESSGPLSMVCCETEGADSDQPYPRGESIVRQRNVLVGLSCHLRVVGLFPVFAYLVSIHPLHHRIIRVRYRFQMDRERTSMDSEIITCKHEALCERGVSR